MKKMSHDFDEKNLHFGGNSYNKAVIPYLTVRFFTVPFHSFNTEQKNKMRKLTTKTYHDFMNEWRKTYVLICS